MKSYKAKVDNIQASGRMQERLLQEIRDVLFRMEKRLKVIEDSVKKEKPKKQLLND